MVQIEKAKTINTVCGMCGFGCGVNVTVEKNEIKKVKGLKEHPLNRGGICKRASNAHNVISHPDRLRHPLKKENKGFKQITWDEALYIIANKLHAIKDQYGAKSLAICFGMPVLTQGTSTISFIRRFCDAYGTPSVFSVDSMCWRSRLIGSILTYGKYPMPDLAESKCILNWATNPHQSAFPSLMQITEAQKKGAKLIVIDPRVTHMARKADMHIQIRPGTDGALLLSMLHTIITEGLYDKDFIVKWTHGFDKLKEHVKQFTPEWAERITWIPAFTIKKMAQIYASTKPATIFSPNNTIEESGNAVQNHRMIAILQAITGNFEVPGGDVTFSRVKRNPVRLEEMCNEKPLGVDKFPLFHGFWGRLLGEGEGQSMLLPDAILKGKPYPVKAAIVSGSNPLMSWPNSTRIRNAFEELEFLVAMDMFMTETASIADIVLPAATGFERTEIYDFYSVLFGVTYIMLRKKVVEVEECWPDLKFYLALAKKMGYNKYFPWKDTDEVIDYMFEPTGLSIKRLLEETPDGMVFGKKKIREYEMRNGFPTPSGKVEIYSETLEELGHDPLPVYKEPPESPISTPKLFEEYPVILTTGARRTPLLHSMFRNVSQLRNATEGPIAEMHPETANKYGIGDGDIITIETKRAKIETCAYVTEDILPGVVSISHGWSEANANLLTDNTPADPISGFPSMRALLCRISKKGKNAK